MFSQSPSSQSNALILQKLPLELTYHIFDKLDADELKPIRLVCQRFHSFIDVEKNMRLHASNTLHLRQIFTSFPQLKHLKVAALDFLGTIFLKDKNITSLKLIDSAIGKIGINNLKEIKGLKELDVYRSELSDIHIDLILDMKELQVFRSRGDSFSSTGKMRIAKAIPQVTFDN